VHAARKATYSLDGHIKTWTDLPVEVRMTEDRDKWRKYVHDGQHQDVDRSPRGRQNDRGQINGESTSMVWLASGSLGG